MAKDVYMTIRVEPDLRSQFTDAAQMQDRPAAQVLREFMRAYVDESTRSRLIPANDSISPAEARRREQAVNFARASVGLEGFKPSKAAEASARRFVKGETRLVEFTQKKNDAGQTHNR